MVERMLLLLLLLHRMLQTPPNHQLADLRLAVLRMLREEQGFHSVQHQRIVPRFQLRLRQEDLGDLVELQLLEHLVPRKQNLLQLPRNSVVLERLLQHLVQRPLLHHLLEAFPGLLEAAKLMPHHLLLLLLLDSAQRQHLLVRLAVQDSLLAAELPRSQQIAKLQRLLQWLVVLV